MKKYKLILTVFLGSIIIAGCNENDLQQENPNELDAGTFFQNAAQVQAATNAVYANLQTTGLYSRHMYFGMDNMSQENGGNNQLEADKVVYLNYSFDADHGATRAYWESCYRGISKANYVIGNADAINAILPSEMANELKQKYIGEAKFMRALYYFFLVTRFGDVPMPLGLPEGTEGLPKTSKDVVYQQIVEDLQDASNTLYEKSVEEAGRANKGAAIALLGKVYLFLEEYQLAMDEFMKIYGQYSLEAEFFDNFREETEHGPESIFEIMYDDEMGNGDVWASDATGHGLNEANLRGQEYGLFDWFNVFPSDDLLDEFEAGDSRFDDSFYVLGDVTGGGKTVTSDILPSNGGGNAGWRKYQNYYKDPNEDTESGINMKYLRYADVLLMMAEAELFRPGGDVATAMGYLNEVRARPSVNLAPRVTLDPDQAFDYIVHERKVELAGEQIRYNDILRWGMTDFLVPYGFEVGKHELMPIPSSEISNNSNLTQEDQNPGY